jgi:cysteine desulfurase / selenocysteine lyase
MDINEVRELFPYLKTGKIYFNHASTGPVSTRVLESLNAFLRNASEGKIDDYPTILATMQETKQELGNYLNCSPDRIAFLDNTTNGINIIASGIEWKKGDRIILNDAEFPANVYPFLNLQNKGIEVHFVKSKNGSASAEDIIEAITPSTRMISISQVQFVSGYRVNLQKIGKICREKGIIFCVDAIQGLGALRIDVEKDMIDFIACGVQKWMLGLQGLSFIYITKELQDKLNPAYIGWLSVNDAWNMLDYKLDLKESAEMFQTGTVNTLGIFSLNASIKLFNEFGYENVENNVLNNSEYLIKRLQKSGIDPLVTGDRKYLSGIVTFRHPHHQNIYEALEQENVICAIREGSFRIAPHFYNTQEEIDRFIEILEKNL